MTGRAAAGRRDLAGSLKALPPATTLPNRLFDELEEAIISGSLEPGERLRADDLALHYGVSLIPVREALRSLDEAGWVEITPRHGVHVRERTDTELRELFEFRSHVEGLVARLAAQRRTDDDLAALDRAVAASGRAREHADDSDLLDASARFRDALRVAAHNSVLEASSEALEKRARFYFSTVAHQLGSEWMRVHEQVLEHVRAHDAQAADDVTREHILKTGEAVHALLFS